jgi:hypothetical protein
MIQETYGDWLTITKELSLNAKKRHLPRIKTLSSYFVTLVSEKIFCNYRKTETIPKDVSHKRRNKLF